MVLFKHLYLFLPFNNFFKSAYTKRNEKNKKKNFFKAYTQNVHVYMHFDILNENK